MVGVPNNANASEPEPVSVMETVLDVPVVSDVIFKFPPSTVTVAPLILNVSAFAQLSLVSQFTLILTVCTLEVPSTCVGVL